MKKLNQRGFAISAILYTMLVLTVLLMFLVIGILANRRATLNKLSSEAKKRMDGTNNLLYNVVKKSPATKDGMENGEEVYYYAGAVNDNYVVFANICWRMVRTTEDGGIKMIYSDIAKNDSGKISCPSYYPLLGPNWWGNGIAYILNYVDDWYDNVVKLSDYEDNLEKIKVCLDTTSNTWNRAVSLNGTVDFSCSDTSEDYVSLTTIYEVAVAGGRLNSANTEYYLYESGKNMGTVSMGNGDREISYINTDGSIASGSQDLTYGIRPVIALKKGTKYASGSGLIDDPYIIE